MGLEAQPLSADLDQGLGVDHHPMVDRGVPVHKSVFAQVQVVPHRLDEVFDPMLVPNQMDGYEAGDSQHLDPEQPAADRRMLGPVHLRQ